MEHTEVVRKDVWGMMSLATVRLIEKLQNGKPGDTVTDEELSEVCERKVSVGGDGYGNLMTAIKHCERNHSVVWTRVAGAGCLRCCNAEDVIELSHRHRKHVRRTAKRGVRQLSTVSFDEATADQRRELTLGAAMMGSLALMADTATMKKIEARGIKKPLQLPDLMAAWKEEMTKSNNHDGA